MKNKMTLRLTRIVAGALLTAMAHNAFATDLAVRVKLLSQPSVESNGYKFNVVVDNTSTLGGGPLDAPGVTISLTGVPTITSGIRITGPRYMPYSFSTQSNGATFNFIDIVEKGDVFTIHLNASEKCDQAKNYGIIRAEVASGVFDPSMANNVAQAAWACEGANLSPEESAKLMGAVFLLTQ